MALEDFQKQIQSPFQTKQPVQDKALMPELVKRMNENARRLHLLEQKIERVESGMRGLDETVLTQLADLKLGLEKISNKLADISDRLATTENETARLNMRLDKAATKSEVKQLETFIDLINPITSKFVTKDELERALEDEAAKMKKRV